MARNGARTFLELAVKVCKLSHLKGFQLGLRDILGEESATAIYAVWTPFCAALELAMSLDDQFNRLDFTLPSEGGSEDQVPEPL